MRVSLWSPAGSDILREIRAFRNPVLAEDTQALIHSVAANPEISMKVIGKINAELPAAHRKFFRICITYSSWYLAFLILNVPAQIALNEIGYKRLASQVGSSLAAGIFIVLILAFFITDYLAWRADYRESYIASHLITALKLGGMYQSGYYALAPLEREHLRDCLALSIQRVAVRYPAVYRRSKSTRFFASRVRFQARKCRNDIVSMIPGLVTASQEEIQAVNADLARLLIRTQTGYWYQTGDIARPGARAPGKYVIRIWLSSFVANSTIQVAIITVVGVVVAAVITRPSW